MNKSLVLASAQQEQSHQRFCIRCSVLVLASQADAVNAP
jgi:hypothetical protein